MLCLTAEGRQKTRLRKSGNMPNVTEQRANPASTTAPSFAARPPTGPSTIPSSLTHTFPRQSEAQKGTYLAVDHLGMLEDGNDVTHYSHAQLVHDFLIEI